MWRFAAHRAKGQQIHSSLRLLNETGLTLLGRIEVRRKEFQSDETVESGVVGSVHIAHASFAELFEDCVVSNDRGDQGNLFCEEGG